MRIKNSWQLLGVFVALLGGCLDDAGPAKIPAEGAQSEPEAVAATVDGAAILVRQVTAEARGGDFNAALQRLIDQRLLLAAARRMHLERDPVIVKALLDLLRERGRAPAPNATREAMIEQALHLGLDHDPRVERAMAQLLLDRKAGAAKISEAAIQAEYARRSDEINTPPSVRLFDIFIKRSSDDDNQALAEATRLQRQIAASPDAFLALARARSAGPSAALGGDLGMVTSKGRSGVAPAVVQAAFALPAQATSAIVPADDGVHVLMVKERRPAIPRSLEQVRPYLMRDLDKQESARLRERVLAELRRAARIEIRRQAWALAAAETPR